MQFTTVFAILAGLAAAAPINPATSHKNNLEKRLDPITISILSTAAASVTTVAIEKAVDLVQAASTWDEAREEFTKEVTRKMWQERKSDKEAAVCYNMAYDVSKPDQLRELVSVKFESGPLHTDYDCFFMEGPDNRFSSHGDGGYINLAVMSVDGICSFEDSTSDVICK
ncbi:hypothetical protein AA0111_g4810 [Neofusicoccum parvum]|uniref:Uncharacterized protein n=1 Tax=Neofusicoccum parvum TaxID=310453 RepID=A0ACB5SEY0_9PEZI|nr:hypothetical protein AA0111_g4810 [Neofusicoccum parvum]